ncbi:MAG: rod shape-determining protein MreD [Sedimentisphaeraceae bacterium JB056]
MKWINFVVTVLVVTLINAGSVMELITISSLDIRPDLLVAALAFFAYISDRRDAIIASFMIGFMADISGSTMGPAMIAYGIVGVSFSAMRDVLLMDRVRNRIFAIFLISVCIMAIIDTLNAFKIGQHIAKPYLAIPLSSVYTALIGAFLWQIFDFSAVLLGVKKKNIR